jgi:hypothetical protein
MDQIKECVDERQKSWCINCGGTIRTIRTNRDHVPSKSLLLKPWPQNLPVVEVCTTCNTSFSLDEEYLAAFLGAVLSGSTEPDRQRLATAARVFREDGNLKARIDRARREYQTTAGETRVLWEPEWHRVHRIITKNARGHAFFEFGEPMLDEPRHVQAVPLEALTREQRAAFEAVPTSGAWPEVGSRMLTRVTTGQDMDGPWVIVQDSVYRYAVAQDDGILVSSVIHEYLATEVYWSD